MGWYAKAHTLLSWVLGSRDANRVFYRATQALKTLCRCIIVSYLVTRCCSNCVQIYLLLSSADSLLRI